MDIKVKREVRVTLSLTQAEAAELAGFLGCASDYRNKFLSELEGELCGALDNVTLPIYSLAPEQVMFLRDEVEA